LKNASLALFRQPLVWGLLLFLLLGKAERVAAQGFDKASLLQGVGKVPLPREPDFMGTLISINEQPEIVLTADVDPDNLSESFQLIALASSRLGKGKLLAFGTAAYFRQPLVQEAEVQKLLANCLRWGSSARPTRVQVWGGDEALTAFLSQCAQVRLVGTATTLDPSATILVLSRAVTDTVVVGRIEKFVRQGGTLLYGYSPPTPDKPGPPPVETQANQLLRKAGLLQTSYLAVRYPHRAFLSAGPVPEYLGIRNVLKSIGADTYPSGPMQGGHILAHVLAKTLAFNQADAPVIQRLKQVAHYRPDSLIVPTATAPVRQGKGGTYVAYLVQQGLLASKLRAVPNPAYVAPAAATFPGAVPATATRLTTELVLPVRVGSNGILEPEPVYRRPHSTGLYVPAGEKVIIYLTARDSARQIQAQIGVHNDDLTHLPQFSREAADLTRLFELKAGRTEIYSPYGGLLLLNIPDTTSLKELRIRVAGAVQAPRFQRGKTSLAEWQQTIRQYPAPWAELASDNVSLTVPAARIRALDDPEKVLAFWDAVLATDARLAGLTTPRRHPELIIVDQDVAYGYMFTVPTKIVVPNDKSCSEMLAADFMWKNGSWGHFHELGHRHQFWGIDFAGLGEVSVNLYTMYVYDKLLHKGLYNHPQLASRQAIADKAAWYLTGAPTFEKWQADPFLALSMYIQLIHSFGWEPIEQVYRQYRRLPKSQYPTTEAARRDYWFSAISTATHRNLGPFFAQWRVPISPAAELAVAGYPVWLPLEMQPKNGFLK
jgi:hypothetical protein